MDVRTISRQTDSCHIVWFYLRLENCPRFGLPEEYRVVAVFLVFPIVFHLIFWDKYIFSTRISVKKTILKSPI